MSVIERMAGNIDKRCDHSQPVYHPCENCIKMRINHIAKRYETDLSTAVGEEIVVINGKLKAALEATKKMEGERNESRDKLTGVDLELNRTLDIVKGRNNQIRELETQLRAERRGKMKVRDLTEAEV